MVEWKLCHPRVTQEVLGYLRFFLSEDNPKSAREQFDEGYKRFGGWRPFHGFTMTDQGLEYPNDPPMPLLAETNLRGETIRFYKGSWVVVIQPDGSYEIAKMD